MSAAKADPQRAFRAGLGACDLDGARKGLADTSPPRAMGPNEAVVLAMRRLPGVNDPKAAFETGRALRILAKLLDEAGAPGRVSEQFRDNLVAAAIAHAGRKPARPWNAEDTMAMFVELFRRVCAASEADCAMIERRLLSWVREELRPWPGGRRAARKPARAPALHLAA